MNWLRCSAPPLRRQRGTDEVPGNAGGAQERTSTLTPKMVGRVGFGDLAGGGEFDGFEEKQGGDGPRVFSDAIVVRLTVPKI